MFYAIVFVNNQIFKQNKHKKGKFNLPNWNANSRISKLNDLVRSIFSFANIKIELFIYEMLILTWMPQTNIESRPHEIQCAIPNAKHKQQHRSHRHHPEHGICERCDGCWCSFVTIQYIAGQHTYVKWNNLFEYIANKS